MKSNKQKCIEMWKWLAEHPDKNKGDYESWLADQGRSDEYRPCWACVETKERSEQLGGLNDRCRVCPIKWTDDGGGCTSGKSPYAGWRHAKDSNQRAHFAGQIVKLIETTWGE